MTFILCTSMGMTQAAAVSLRWETLKILSLGIIAFGFSTVGGVLFGKLMYRLTGGKVNPLIAILGSSPYAGD